jgi:alkylation response protein AidB-like acyl-CoA dehydrogenase
LSILPVVTLTATSAAEIAAGGAAAADRERRLGRATVAALDAAGFARHFVGREYGGREGRFAELFDATVEVALGCPAAAWCAALWATHGRFSGFLPDAGRAEIWAGGPDVRISSAILPPAGTIAATAGGWLVSGRWEYASGVEFADWVLLSSTEPDAGVLMLAVPRDAVSVEDTWDSTGLRGTGSHSVVAHEVFVPGRRAVPLGTVLRGDGGPDRVRCHRVPAHLAGGLLFAAPALGAARHALHAWTWWARKGLADEGALQETLAHASAELDATELLLRSAIRRADDGPVDSLSVARNHRDAVLGVQWLVSAVDRLFRAGGSHARDAGSEVQRCWRDVHTVAAHGALRLTPAAARYAAALAGTDAA